MGLRYYQSDALKAVYRYLEERKDNPCVVLPTGAGKTHVIAQLCAQVQAWGGRALVVAHVKELLEQAKDKLHSLDRSLDVGVYSASLKSRDVDSQVLLAGVQSVYNRGLELCGAKPFSLVVVDEAHRIPIDGDGMYQKLLGDLKTANPKLRVVGLTATPYRTGDGYVCGKDHFLNEVCYEVGIKELISGGYLCPLSSKRSSQEVDTSGLRVQRGDFIQSEMEERFATEDNVGPAVAEILKLTRDRKRVLIFCCGIDHASSVAIRLEEAGRAVRVVTSQHAGRDQAVDTFRNGGCKYLVNVNVLTEGFDVTSIDAVILLRATVSPGLYYQMCGRGLRIDPSKQDCLILDYGGNIQRHGTLDNLVIKSGKSGGRSGEAPVKACPECNEMVHAGLAICSACGFEFPPSEPNHEETAAESSPLEEQAEEWEVDEVAYSVHQKRVKEGEEPKPPSMRVSYYSGLSVIADEWICIEHSGYAWEKAYGWWSKRSNQPMPKTVEDGVVLGSQGAVAEPSRIKVRNKPGSRFKEIIEYELGEKPELVEVSEEEVPF